MVLLKYLKIKLDTDC